jgi:hypothetical protein
MDLLSLSVNLNLDVDRSSIKLFTHHPPNGRCVTALTHCQAGGFMSSREMLEGRLEAERACALIIATSRTPDEAKRRLRSLLFQLMLHLSPN